MLPKKKHEASCFFDRWTGAKVLTRFCDRAHEDKSPSRTAFGIQVGDRFESLVAGGGFEPPTFGL